MKLTPEQINQIIEGLENPNTRLEITKHKLVYYFYNISKSELTKISDKKGITAFELVTETRIKI